MHWSLKLARLLDKHGEIPENAEAFKEVLAVFRKEKFRDGQLEIVLAALRGESMLVVRPTGSGKTLCFQVPTLLRPGTAFVISPLKALMADQISELQKNCIPGTFINSDLSPTEKESRYELHDKCGWKFLYLTPERFDSEHIRNPFEISRLVQTPPNFLVIDEAHCVDRWGDDFRPAYGRLDEVRKQLGNPPVLAFTATAGKEAQYRILGSLGIPDAKRFITGANRPNISLVRCFENNDEKRLEIIERAAQRTDGKTMIFVPTVAVGEQVQADLHRRGMKVPFYHGKLPGNDRDMLLGQFTGRLEPEVNTIICTNAFGMGLDVGNVRNVIHWMQPESVEDYLQEFGRAGRDGKPAIAIIFKSQDDIGLRKFMAERSGSKGKDKKPDPQVVERRLKAIKELDKMIRGGGQCFRRSIISYFGEETGKKPSLAMRLLEWLFSVRLRVKQGDFCCDACSPEKARSLLYPGNVEHRKVESKKPRNPKWNEYRRSGYRPKGYGN